MPSHSPNTNLSAQPGVRGGQKSGHLEIRSNTPIDLVVQTLSTNISAGLSAEEVESRRRQYGYNEITGKSGPAIWSLVLRQFQSSVVYLLGIATVISLVMHESLQAVGILLVLLINAAVGAAMEYRAQTSLAGLMKLTSATARVKRSNNEHFVSVRELVPGDIVLLAPGERVPADMRIAECASLSVDESALSGESTAVYKEAQADEETSNSSLLFQGTLVMSGRALAVVTATGFDSTLGKMARLMTGVSEAATPLEKQLMLLGDDLTRMTVIVCILVGLIGILHHKQILAMFETSVTLAVAAIPEALPLVATLAMAVGIGRMVRAQALIRRLPAVETLGCTTVICTDKTGTLTENKMLMTDLVLAHHKLKLSGNGYAPIGELTENGHAAAPDVVMDAELLLTAAALCNDAKLENHEEEGGWHIHGDPTEGALLTAAQKLGISSKVLQQRHKRIAELPFDLARKRMSTLHKIAEQEYHLLFVKGAPEIVLKATTRFLSNGQELAMHEDVAGSFRNENRRMAEAGLRVLAVARRAVSAEALEDGLKEQLESNLVLLGLVGLADQAKPGVREAIDVCHSAGIRVVMLTGDQLATAKAIGTELGIVTGDTPDQSLDATLLSQMSDDSVAQTLSHVTVLSRLSPDAKLRVVRMFQRCGEVVAMTGDGINDAPALKQADIGIAMGAEGTQMACEAASLVITNDDFSTIVKAIEHGRITYDNIQRSVAYLLTASLTSVLIVTLGIITDTGLLLKPLQLLSLNLIMHVFPALGLIVQTYDRGLMTSPPRSRESHILGRTQLLQILLRSTLISVIVLASVLAGQFTPEHAATAVLFSVSLNLLLQSWLWLAKPSGLKSLLNLPMLTCTLLALSILFISIYFSPVALALNTVPLSLSELRFVGLEVIVVCLITFALGNSTSRFRHRSR